MLRSLTVEGVDQEAWGFYCVHYALRGLVAAAADDKRAAHRALALPEPPADRGRPGPRPSLSYWKFESSSASLGWAGVDRTSAAGPNVDARRRHRAPSTSTRGS